MTQPIFRRVQKRNPHQLVIDQHVHAAHCIKKFADENGTVSVFDKSSSQWLKRKPNASIFCAKRAWDQRAEKGFMNDIERNYFQVIDNIDVPFNERNHNAITCYYHLWRLRGAARVAERRDWRLKGVMLERELTQDAEEMLESHGVLCLTENSELSSHRVNGLQIQRSLDECMAIDGTITWGLVTAKKGEFIVSDFYPGDSEGLAPFIPVSPKHVFYARKSDVSVGVGSVRNFNRVTLRNSQMYYFCKDIRNCPF